MYFYNICYDEKNQKVLHSAHQIISPKLLNSKLLLRERNVTYDMRDDFKISSTNGNEVFDNIKGETQVSKIFCHNDVLFSRKPPNSLKLNFIALSQLFLDFDNSYFLLLVQRGEKS